MDRALKQQGYLVCTQEHALLRTLQSHQWQRFLRFANNWQFLKNDPFLRDEGSYRLRRYSVFHWHHSKIIRLPHEPHFQKSQYNGLHGGFNRFFYPWRYTRDVERLVSSVVAWVTSRIHADARQHWRIQAHQFRIVATADQAGKPTPEGIHKDGADFILIMLMKRHNVVGGVSQIYDNNKQLLEQVCLEQPGDLVLIDDKRIYHGVTALLPDDVSKEAYRDVLVLTFHRLIKK